MEHPHHQPGQASDRQRLLIVLAVTICFFAVELAGGYYANSLALMTDAVHILTDIAALCLSLLTLWISSRPASAAKTFGYLRAEILGALLNGLFLWALVVFVWFEAAQRIRKPPVVHAPTMILIAAIGVVVNSFSAWMTFGGRGPDGRAGMAVRAVFVHVISDLVGSLGVLTAGALAWFTGWREADPIVSILIGGLIIYGSWELVRDGVDILMESVPAAIDLDELRRDLLAVRDTEEVHDLHVWCLTGREFALAAHAVVTRGADHDRVLGDMAAILEDKFNIRHMTVQLERDNRREQEPEHF
ncbi:MAG: cation transporter [Candidatus Binataceae bacterium]|nr:cation transporter [Candidatus Binataceae bacterium]